MTSHSHYRQSSSRCHQSSDEQHNMLSIYRHLALLSLNLHLINLPQSHMSITTQSQQASLNFKHLQIISGTKIRWGQESGLLIKIIQVSHTALAGFYFVQNFFLKEIYFLQGDFHLSNLTFHPECILSTTLMLFIHYKSKSIPADLAKALCPLLTCIHMQISIRMIWKFSGILSCLLGHKKNPYDSQK